MHFEEKKDPPSTFSFSSLGKCSPFVSGMHLSDGRCVSLGLDSALLSLLFPASGNRICLLSNTISLHVRIPCEDLSLSATDGYSISF